MRSDEVLKRATERIGVKSLAATLRLSPALIYKWCQESDVNDPDASGARNPLDRLADVVRATGDTEVVNWLCHEAGGFFVPNPRETPQPSNVGLLMKTQQLVREFSHLLNTVTKSIADDNVITPEEADRIRSSWEALKQTAEGFTVAAERGAYHVDPES
jgi:hypothetical protein